MEQREPKTGDLWKTEQGIVVLVTRSDRFSTRYVYGG